MVLKLYSFPASTCSQRIGMVLNEKGVPFELHIIDMAKKEHKSAEFLKIQPFGQVPYIDDEGFIVYESRAIARYIEAKYPNQGTKLAPTIPEDGIEAYARFEQALSVEISHFNPGANGAVAEKRFKPMGGGVPDEAVFAKYIQELESKLAVYDQILSKQKYVAGNELTMVDLFHIPYGNLLPTVGSDVLTSDRFPNVARWWKDITSRPSWLAVRDLITSTAAKN